MNSEEILIVVINTGVRSIPMRHGTAAGLLQSEPFHG